ncbi:regulatory protein [Butyrivibrio sp. INlla18]|uniref:regulatory protein RecX n=1 Tax=Butyrivibrio sp. INlla18 TaxID=1520806 RepID=UPI00088405DF|nr:regulatory protein RecX [Butyrivibrio sp. INlla18]SDA51455.1 regulatory protein [Butyrivibrio sp. INlla18]
MIVSDIVELDKKRSKVYIDGEFAFVMYKGEFREYGIKLEAEISEETYDSIITVLLPKRATKRAMNLLQKRDYTEAKLREKLSEGLYPSDAIDAAIDYVKSYHYLDDERYARDYITYHMPTKSKNRIVQDLTNKGIKKDLLIPILEEIYEEEDDDPESSQIEALLQKKHYSKELDYKEQQKIIAFLLRRGFSLDKVKRVINSVSE